MEKKINIRPYLRQFYRGNMGYLFLGLVHTLFSTAASLLISWLIQQIIDLIGGIPIGFTFRQIICLVLLGGILYILDSGFAYFSKPRFIAKASSQYKNYIFSRLSQKGIAAFTGENTATYLSALSNDVTAIESGYLSNLFVIAQQAMLFLGALALMFYYNPLLTFVAITFALAPILASIATGGLVEKAEAQVSHRNESYMSTLRDSLSGFSVIKSFQAEAQICKMLARQIARLDSAKEHRRKMAIIVQTCGMIAGFVLQFGVFLVGAYLALSGSNISAGSVLVFVQLLNYVINPIATIPQAIAECKASKALIRKIAKLLETNVRTEGSTEKRTLTEAITLEGLSFAYGPEKPVLQDISFRLEAGKSYCLVGASGSGKSTLLNLLMASAPGYGGTIRYDDVELRDISSEALYDMVSVVAQNVFIFNASIRDNITMFSEFPKETVDRAIALSGLKGLIEERGEDYLCGENGSGLSGGEKQRISIARSLLKRSQVLLVDEATAALDAQTANQVINAILDLQDLTRIVVTHALEEPVLRRYDCILTLKNGRIAESGSFDALMERKGYFYSLFTVAQ